MIVCSFVTLKKVINFKTFSTGISNKKVLEGISSKTISSEQLSHGRVPFHALVGNLEIRRSEMNCIKNFFPLVFTFLSLQSELLTKLVGKSFQIRCKWSQIVAKSCQNRWKLITTSVKTIPTIS
ncbi:MAG: hypothetical protein CMB97_01450 [Flavobacteriaceae bacterium]|nr:hypothetical protein [Flavobacteriaceae bacterium]